MSKLHDGDANALFLKTFVCSAVSKTNHSLKQNIFKFVLPVDIAVAVRQILLARASCHIIRP